MIPHFFFTELLLFLLKYYVLIRFHSYGRVTNLSFKDRYNPFISCTYYLLEYYLGQPKTLVKLFHCLFLEKLFIYIRWHVLPIVDIIWFTIVIIILCVHINILSCVIIYQCTIIVFFFIIMILIFITSSS